jgi:hypothetical protein
MLGHEFRTAEYWRERADATYAEACRLKDRDAKRTMLQIAKMYAAMAVRTEVWEAESALTNRKRAAAQDAL